MRAYLRLDPRLADRKRDYPDGAFRAFVECLTFAEQQPERGYFRNERLLRVLLEKRARWVLYLIQHGDLIEEADGRLYLDGWREWQEGDWKVAERVARIRNRKTVTPTVTPTVTDTVTNGVSTPYSGGGKRLAVGEAEAEAARRDNGPPTFMGFRPRADLADVIKQHDRDFDPCSKCGARRGGPAHGPNRDHDFEPAA